MSRICYIERSFYTKARAVVDQANAICEEYAAQGLDLTLRQLYYQFVARGRSPTSRASTTASVPS